MDDICRKINCKHIKWTRSNPESCTAYCVCKLKDKTTDENHCAKCKDRVPRREETEKALRGGVSDA